MKLMSASLAMALLFSCSPVAAVTNPNPPIPSTPPVLRPADLKECYSLLDFPTPLDLVVFFGGENPRMIDGQTVAFDVDGIEQRFHADFDDQTVCRVPAGEAL